MIVGHKAPELAPFSTRSWCRGLFPEQPGQHRGLAVVEILRRGEQRQRLPGRGQGAQPAERGPLRGAGQLAEVTLAEFVELGRVVPVPGTQLGGRRDVLGPVVQPECVLAQAARPDPVDEHAGAVLHRRLLVDAARPDLGNGTHLCKSTQTVLPAAPSGSTPHWLAIASTAPSPCSGMAGSVFPRSGVASRTEIRSRSSSADKMTVNAEWACTMALAAS